MSFYNVVLKIFTLYSKVFYKYEVIGAENIPDEGNIILAANHKSNLDPIFVASAVKNRKVATIGKKELFDKGIRVELDDRAEKIGYKIREAQLQKVPYMLIVGEKEVNENKISVRSRDNGEMGAIEVEEFIANVLKEVEERANVAQV